MVGIIIQARMGSSRLAGKVLMKIGDKTLLEHIISRLQPLSYKYTIVIATSDLPMDDCIYEFCSTNNIKCFRGEEQNVLKRYYDCATEYHFTHIVRLTADNPFPDIDELQRLILFYLENEFEYADSFSTLPIGVGAEIFSYKALQDSMYSASLPKHFEHPNEYILDNLDRYKNGKLNTCLEKNKPDVRLTVDTKEDYEKACYIAKYANVEYITTEKAIEMSRKYDMCHL